MSSSKKVSQWTAKGEMPTPFTDVVGLMQNGNMLIVFYSGHSNRYINSATGEGVEITHWLYVPVKPF